MIKPPSEFVSICSRISDFLEKSYEIMLKKSIAEIVPDVHSTGCYIICSPKIDVYQCSDIAFNVGGNLHAELIKQLKEKYNVDATIHTNSTAYLQIIFNNLIDVISNDDFCMVCERVEKMLEYHIEKAISEGNNHITVSLGKGDDNKYCEKILGTIFKDNEYYKYRFIKEKEGWFNVSIHW